MATGIESDIQRTVVGKAAVDTQFIRGGVQTLNALNISTLQAIAQDLRHAGTIVHIAGSFYKYTLTDLTNTAWGNTGNWVALATINDVGNTISDASVDDDGNLTITLQGGSSISVGNIKGPKGDPGESGNPGISITNVTETNGVITFTNSENQAFTTGNLSGEDGQDGAGVTIVGSKTVAEINSDSTSGLVAGDMFIATDTGTVNNQSTVPGDGIVWTGSAFENVGQIRGPKGDQGVPGTPGQNGNPGQDGAPGQDGDDGQDGAAATIAVGTVETLGAGNLATVTNAGTAAAAVFNFEIPRGADGSGGSGGGGTLTSAITIGRDVGGLSTGTVYSAGTAIQTIIEDLVAAPYVPPSFQSISSAYLKNGGTTLSTSITKNYGQSITFDSVHWSTTGTSGTATATTLYADDESPSLSVTLNDTSSPATFTSKTIKMPYSGFAISDHTMTVKLSNTNGNGAASTTRTACTVTYKTPKLFGTSASNLSSPTSGLLNGLSEVELDTNKPMSFTGTSATGNPSNYIYFAYPAFYGSVTTLTVGTNPTNQINGVTQISSNFSWTYNSTAITMRVYKFNNPGVVLSGKAVAIS